MTLHFCFHCAMGTPHHTILNVPTCTRCQRRNDTQQPWGMLLVQYWVDVLIPRRLGPLVAPTPASTVYAPSRGTQPMIVWESEDHRFVYGATLRMFRLLEPAQRHAVHLVWGATSIDRYTFQLSDNVPIFVGEIAPRQTHDHTGSSACDVYREPEKQYQQPLPLGDSEQ